MTYFWNTLIFHQRSIKNARRRLSPRQWQCFAHLPLKTTKCPSCNTKIGGVDKLGFAKRPFDWSGYLIAIIAILGFCLFVWWGFFTD